MKKIIYSLVIMIAAGSLFTSCIEQVEPLGIQDMRFAKAEYIRALKDLRAADAELVRAEAAHELARARYVDAMTANLNADTEYQKLLNEYQQLLNEARQDTNDFISQETANKIDSIKKRMELRELQHQKDMVAAQDSLANAQERLRVALRNIALASQSLTANEKEALENATKAYEIAFEKVANQTVKVFKAQQAVHKAEIELAKADKEIDEDTYQYVDALEYYKRKLALAEASALLNGAALLAIGYNFDNPEDVSGIIIPEDLAEWKGQIDALADSLAILDYSKAATITEIANYYVANIHDGVAAFNNAVAEFGAENDLYTDDPTVDPRDPSTWDNVPELTDAEADTLSWGTPKQEDFKMGNADTIAMPALKFDSPNFAFDQFKNMTSGYFAAFTNAAPGATGNYQIGGQDVIMMKVDGGYWKLYAKQAWKDFILGTDKGTVKSQNYVEKDEDGNVVVDVTTDYGLKGAVSVLERKRVYKEEEGLNYADSLEKYKKVWEDNRNILSTVNNAYFAVAKKNRVAIATTGGPTKDSLYMKSYQPYADALAAYNVAKQALNQKVQDSATVAGKMVTAIDNFITLYNDHINGGTWSTADSTMMLKAAVDFAAAREEYFATAGLKKDTLDFLKEDTHPDYLHYLKAGNPKTMDSIEFNKLTIEKLRETVTMTKKSDASDYTVCKYSWIWNTVDNGADTAKTVFNQIFDQMFGADMVTLLDGGTLLTDTAIFNANNYKAFYQEFQYDKTKKNFKKANGDPLPTVADDERDDLKDAEDDLNAARNQYRDVYKSYWGTTAYVTSNKPEDEVKATSYTDTTFIEPFPIVNFNVGATAVDTTAGLAAVLESIDAQTAPRMVLGDNATTHSDFWQYMKWLSLNGTIDEDSLNKIKEWVSAVEHAFALDAEAAGMPDTAAYNKAKEAYERVSEKSKKVDEYVAAKKAFTGEDEDGNANEIVVIAGDYDKFADFFTKDEVSFELAAEDPIYEVYTGKWIKGLGGKQLEIANTLFPKLPENMKAWQDELNSINDRKEHVETLQTAYDKAYKSAAKAKYDVEGSDLATVIENVQKQVVEDFAEVIAAYNEAVGTEDVEGKIQFYTEAIRDYDENIHVGKVHPAELALAKAQKNLAIETERLNGYQNVLAYAKANLDKILEYIKSLDVNFVVVTDDDITNNK